MRVTNEGRIKCSLSDIMIELEDSGQSEAMVLCDHIQDAILDNEEFESLSAKEQVTIVKESLTIIKEWAESIITRLE